MLLLCVSLLYQSEPSLSVDQAYHYQRITMEDGLASDTVIGITQDDYGYIWLATGDGLNRFDGDKMLTMRHIANRNDSLSGNEVMHLFCDREGRIWAGTFDHGLNEIDPNSLVVKRYEHRDADPTSLSHNRVTAIVQDDDGFVWVGTADGLNRLDPRTGSIKIFQHANNKNSLSHSAIQSLFVDDKGVLWVATLDGFNRFDRVTSSFERFYVEKPLGENLVCSIKSAGSNDLWIAENYGGVSRFDTKKRVFESRLDELAGVPIYTMHSDRQGQLWIGTAQQGIYCRAPDGNVTQPIYDLSDANSLAIKPISSVFEDAESVFWFGTFDAGVYRFNPRTLDFPQWRINEDGRDIGAAITAITSGQTGEVWIGIRDAGVIQIDKHRQVTRDWEFDAQVNCLLADRSQRLWVGLRKQGVVQIELETGAQTHFLADTNGLWSLSHEHPTVMIEDRSGNICIGTRGGLNIIEPEVVSQYTVESHGSKGMVDDRVFALSADNRGGIWVGVSFGTLLYLNESREEFAPFTLSERSALDPFDLRVAAISSSRAGNLWVGVHGEGVKSFDLDSSQVDDIESGQTQISGIYEDGQQRLWVYGEKGLSCINLLSRDIRVYDQEDGLIWKSFLDRSFSRRSQGELVLGGTGGYFSFNPDKIQPDANPPRVYFTDVEVFGQPLHSSYSSITHNIGYKQKAKLTHKQNTLTLRYAGLQFASPSKISFRHRLEPLDKHWQYGESGQRSLNYYNLPPGQYVLALEAANADAVWSPQRQFPFEIANPPWRTWWAFMLYALISMAAIASWTRMRTRMLRKRAGELESEVRLRTQSVREQKDTIERLLKRKDILFANVSHEFRTPLTLIMGPITRMLAAESPFKDQLNMIRRNATRLLRMVDQLLDLARLGEHEPSNSTPLNVTSHLNFMVQSFLPVVEAQGQTLTQDVHPHLSLMMPQDVFEKIVSNLLSNAVKYAGRGASIHVHAFELNDRVMLEISDNGPGIEAEYQPLVFERFYRLPDSSSSEGAGIGLSLAKELVEAHNGSIELISSRGHGVLFRIGLPANHDAISSTLEPSEHHPTLELELQTLTQPQEQNTHAERDQTEQRPTVLVIEDHMDMRTYIVEELSEIADCSCASDGVSGLAEAQNQVPDLIVCDVMMPGMDGFQLNEALKSNELTSHIPVILLTARGDQESRLRGLKGRADAYLTKPFDATELRVQVENLLTIRELLKKRFGRMLLATEDQPNIQPDELNAVDEQFLSRFTAVLDKNYSNSEFSLSEIVALMHTSERPLQRKLKALTDHTPSQYLRLFRLQKARSLLQQGQTASQVAFAVGFSSHAYFTTCFKAQFGVVPSHYVVPNPD